VLRAIEPDGRLMLPVRAGAVAAVAVCAGSTGHVAAGGCLPVPGVLAAAAVCFTGARVAVRRPPSPCQLALWLVAFQLMTHAMLELWCVNGGPTRTGGAGAPPLLQAAAGHLLMGESPVMVTAHLAAVAVSAAVLQRSDAALWLAARLARSAAAGRRRLARPLLLILAAPPDPAPRPVVVCTDRAGWSVCTWHPAQPPRRGPPAAPAV
jgi:hypothetical protein